MVSVTCFLATTPAITTLPTAFVFPPLSTCLRHRITGYSRLPVTKRTADGRWVHVQCAGHYVNTTASLIRRCDRTGRSVLRKVSADAVDVTQSTAWSVLRRNAFSTPCPCCRVRVIKGVNSVNACSDERPCATASRPAFRNKIKPANPTVIIYFPQLPNFQQN